MCNNVYLPHPFWKQAGRETTNLHELIAMPLIDVEDAT